MDLGTRPLWQVIAHIYAYLVEPYDRLAATEYAADAAKSRTQLDARLADPDYAEGDDWGMDAASEAANRWLDAFDDGE